MTGKPAPSSSSRDAPRTLAQWRAHIDGLSDDALLAEASAANGIAFVEVLEQEGCAPDVIHAILHAFASALAGRGLRAPGGGLYDYSSLARRSAPVVDEQAASSGNERR